MSDLNNHILIDDAISDIVADGHERLNLGAWANMERMLDGQNPYADDDKKKRRGIFFLLGFIVLSIISGLSYFAFNSNQTKPIAQNNTPKVEGNDNKQNTVVSSNTESTQSATHQTSLPLVNQTETITEQNNTPNARKITRYKKSKNRVAESTTDNDITTNMSQDANHDVVIKQTDNNIQATEIQMPVESHTQLGRTSQQQKSSRIKKGLKQRSNNKGKDVLVTAKEIETIPVVAALPVEPVQKMTSLVVKQNKYTGKEDTLDKTYTQIIAKQELPVTVTNPRFVELSKEEEQKVNNTKEILPTAIAEPLLADNTINKKTNDISKATRTKKQNESLQNAKDKLNDKIDNMKNATMASLNLKVPTNFGFYAGVNNNFNTGKSDVGGFHAGVNMMMRLKPNLYFVPHISYLYKFNTGISLVDYQITNPYQSSPTTFVKDSRTYNSYTTTYDSTSAIWNFNRFQNIEMPLVLQYEKGRLGYYGGMNLAYGFKIKNSVTTPSMQTVTHIDTVLATEPLSPRNMQNYMHTNRDFNSRLGVGIVAGINYYVTPNIYIDAKVSKNLWTNTKVPGSERISSYFFTSPSIQLSFGYRLKSKEIARKQ